MAVPQRTLNWLYSVLIRDHYDPQQTYQDPNRTYYDVANALAQYPSLSPRTDVYTYETGFSALLLLLTGTLPVSFRGAVYKFPVALWIPTNYPREPPLVYVTPTQDMVVRAGQHVTLDGRVYHPYLARWLEAWDRSTIVDFLSILRNVFATEPPVKYKQRLPVQQPPSQHMPTPPPVPPLPPDFAPQSQPQITHVMPSPRPADVPPPPPPKPGQIQQQQQQAPAGRYDSPPPLPPLPPEEQARRISLAEGGGLGQAQGQAHGYRGQPVVPAYSSQQVRGWQQIPCQPPIQSPAHQQRFSQLIATPSTQPIPNPAPKPHPKPASPAPDLLTSPFELSLPTFTPTAAPPIPPNPEKDALLRTLSQTLSQTITSNINQSSSAAQSLLSQSHSLHAAVNTLQSEIAGLHALNKTLEDNTVVLKDSLARADGVITNAKSRLAATTAETPSSSTDPATQNQAQGQPAIDEILVAPTLASNQLYDLVAEEAGIQQAIYALQSALVRGVIGAESWSRHTRGLAREAFLKRALSRKVARGLGCEGV